jgi:hypothetical protein
MHEVIMFLGQTFSIQAQGIILPQILKPNNPFLKKLLLGQNLSLCILGFRVLGW